MNSEKLLPSPTPLSHGSMLPEITETCLSLNSDETTALPLRGPLITTGPNTTLSVAAPLGDLSVSSVKPDTPSWSQNFKGFQRLLPVMLEPLAVSGHQTTQPDSPAGLWDGCEIMSKSGQMNVSKAILVKVTLFMIRPFASESSFPARTELL